MNLKEKLANDELILHKIGFLLGSLVGVLIGGLVSKRADDYEKSLIPDILEDEMEVRNGETEH